VKPLLLLLLLIVSAPALDFACLRFSVPPEWRPLDSPGASLLRWSCEAEAAAIPDGPIDEAWLARQVPARRVALSAMPTSAADLPAAGEHFIARLSELVGEVEVEPVVSRQYGQRQWLEIAHRWRFAGQPIHQVTWLTLTGAGGDRRCLALSCSSGSQPEPAWLETIRAMLASASSASD
jgi:hypothetical protein